MDHLHLIIDYGVIGLLLPSMSRPRIEARSKRNPMEILLVDSA